MSLIKGGGGGGAGAEVTSPHSPPILTLILTAREEKNFQMCKDSQKISLNKVKYEKICNPSLIYINNFYHGCEKE